jgi:hypothetical protein
MLLITVTRCCWFFPLMFLILVQSCYWSLSSYVFLFLLSHVLLIPDL